MTNEDGANASANQLDVITAADSASETPSDATAPNGPSNGSVTARYCTTCKKDVEPIGKGNCPVCGRTVLGNTLPLKHGSRRATPTREMKAEADALERDLIEKYGSDPLTLMEIHDTAAVETERKTFAAYLLDPSLSRRERHAAAEIYLTLSARAERLRDRLRDLKPAAAGAPTLTPESAGDLSLLSSRDFLAVCERLAEDARAHVELDEARAARVEEAFETATTEPDVTPPLEPLPEQAPSAPVDSPEWTSTDPDKLRILDGDKPEERARRDAEATVEMLAMVGHPNTRLLK